MSWGLNQEPDITQVREELRTRVRNLSVFRRRTFQRMHSMRAPNKDAQEIISEMSGPQVIRALQLLIRAERSRNGLPPDDGFKPIVRKTRRVRI